VKLKVDSTTVTRRDDNALDHRADRLNGFITQVRIAKKALQLGDAATMRLRQVRMDKNRSTHSRFR